MDDGYDSGLEMNGEPIVINRNINFNGCIVFNGSVRFMGPVEYRGPVWYGHDSEEDDSEEDDSEDDDSEEDDSEEVDLSSSDLNLDKDTYDKTLEDTGFYFPIKNKKTGQVYRAFVLGNTIHQRTIQWELQYGTVAGVQTWKNMNPWFSTTGLQKIVRSAGSNVRPGLVFVLLDNMV